MEAVQATEKVEKKELHLEGPTWYVCIALYDGSFHAFPCDSESEAHTKMEKLKQQKGDQISQAYLRYRNLDNSKYCYGNKPM